MADAPHIPNRTPASVADSGPLAKVQRFLARYERALDIFGLVWFWAGIAIYARWISLPEILFLTDGQIMFLGIAFNAVWWGFLRPKIEKMKRQEISQEGGADG